ncbi:hypothetical protein [Lutibacter sp.]
MNSRKLNKILITVLVIIISIAIFIAFLYIKMSNDKFVPLFAGVLFALIPAVIINAIWNNKSQKKDI